MLALYFKTYYAQYNAVIIDLGITVRVYFVSYDIQNGQTGFLICTHKPTKGKLDMSKGKYRYEINDNCACYFCYETLKFFPNLPCILVFLYYSNTSVTGIIGLLSQPKIVNWFSLCYFIILFSYTYSSPSTTHIQLCTNVCVKIPGS